MSEMAAPAPQMRFRDRLAAAFLLLVLGVGALVLWIGVPALCLWGASKITNSIVSHYLVATPATLVAMVAFGWFLYWVDRLYLRVTGAFDPTLFDEDYDDEDDDEPRIPRGPLEPLLIASLFIAVAALFVWFFVFAENPSSLV
jgi:hypothetical protein